MAKKSSTKTVETLQHSEAKRRNIPTAEFQSVLEKEQESPKKVRYHRNTDLDPQLVWRGKDEQDWSDLVVHAPPLYIQEKVHPKALIDELLKETKERAHEEGLVTADLFGASFGPADRKCRLIIATAFFANRLVPDALAYRERLV